jgi:hypothetical protein
MSSDEKQGLAGGITSDDIAEVLDCGIPSKSRDKPSVVMQVFSEICNFIVVEVD